MSPTDCDHHLFLMSKSIFQSNLEIMILKYLCLQVEQENGTPLEIDLERWTDCVKGNMIKKGMVTE